MGTPPGEGQPEALAELPNVSC